MIVSKLTYPCAHCVQGWCKEKADKDEIAESWPWASGLAPFGDKRNLSEQEYCARVVKFFRQMVIVVRYAKSFLWVHRMKKDWESK